MLNLIPIRLWLAAAAVAAVLTFIGWQQWRLHSMRATVAEALATLAEASRTIDQCTAALTLQNQAVEHWKAAADIRSKRAQEALKQAASVKRDAEKRARALNTIVLSGDECADLSAIVDAARAGGM
jgi:Tfp pilus assembly major pilin PilA